MQAAQYIPQAAKKEVPTGSEGDGVAPFILGEALPTVPVRLVKKGEFVDMAELLHA